MAVLETVKIVSKDTKSGYKIINKSDFTNKDKLFVEKVKVGKKEEIAEEKVTPRRKA